MGITKILLTSWKWHLHHHLHFLLWRTQYRQKAAIVPASAVMHFYSAHSGLLRLNPLKIQLIPQQVTALFMQELYRHSTELPEAAFIGWFICSPVFSPFWQVSQSSALSHYFIFPLETQTMRSKPLMLLPSDKYTLRLHFLLVFSRLNYYDFREST